jgi:hypothetical protein
VKFSDMARASKSAPDETYSEVALKQAVEAFERGTADTRKAAVIYLAQAWHLAVTKGERLDEEEATKLFCEVTNAAGVW